MAEVTDNPDTQDKLAKYRPAGQAPAATATPATPAKKAGPVKTAYTAFALSKGVKKHLELRVKFPEPSDNPLYQAITNIRIEWRRGLAVTVVFGKTMSIEIKGKNLQELGQAIKDCRVDFIEEYDPRFHLPVTDDKAPFIRSIEVIKRLAEEVPPMNQRH